jgi:CRP-like cAMP-binding protein
MAPYLPDLQTTLRLHGEPIRKSKSAVLFRRGQKADGMFVIVRGKVSLDFGVDSAFARGYGEDAELVFWSLRELNSLLQKRPDFCRQLLEILGERMAENQKMMKAMLSKDQQPLDEQLEQPTAI